MKQALYLPVAVALLGGCSVSLADAGSDGRGAPSPQLCETDDDCAEGAACESGYCVADRTIFDTVLFEISVPNAPSAEAYAGTRFMRTLQRLPPEGGVIDLGLSEPVSVVLSLAPPPCEDAAGELVERRAGACPAGAVPPSGRSCSAYDFAATPIEVTLTPSERALGLSTVRYSTTAGCADSDCERASAEFTVPPGEYDVYVRQDPTIPSPPPDTCRVVPEIFGVAVPADVQLQLDYELAPPSLLEVRVEWPLGDNDPAALDGWTIDMLDPTSARRVSTQAVLADPVLEGDLASYEITLAYVTPSTEASPGAELVRLRPPDDAVAPTIVMERSALQLFSGPAVIDHLTALPEPVEVEGQILAQTSFEDSAQLAPVSGTVTLVATELEVLPPGVLASYRHTVEVPAGDDGVFRARLLPGTYRVRVAPPGACSETIPCQNDEPLCTCPLAATEVTDFTVAPSPRLQAGKSVELAWRTRVTGDVRESSGAVVAGAEVLAISVPQRSTALETALGEEPFVPRATSTETSSRGHFELLADAGSYNLSVRPEDDEGLAWLVRPNVPVTGTDAVFDLEQLVLPLPVSYVGNIAVPGNAATIRAYVAVDPADPQSTVVQVAEATTDETGDFQLLLPASLEHER